MIKKLLSPVLWEWSRAEIVQLFLNIISLCLDAFSLIQFAYPFKTEAFISVPQVLIFLVPKNIILQEKNTSSQHSSSFLHNLLMQQP